MKRIVESNQKPESVDETSSGYVVYVRDSIKEEERTDEQGETYKVWVYKEQEIPKSQYENYKSIMEAQFMITELDLQNLELQSEIQSLKGDV